MSFFFAGFLPLLGALLSIWLHTPSLIAAVVSISTIYTGGCAFFLWDNRAYDIYEIFFTSAFPSVCMACAAIGVKSWVIIRQNTLNDSKTRIQTLEKGSNELMELYKNSVSIKENLEKRILKDDSFALKLQDAVSALSSLKEKEIRGKLLEIAEEFLRAKAVGYYSYQGGRFYLSASLNPPANIPTRIGKESPLYFAIMESSSVLTVKDKLKPEDYAIMACKIPGASNTVIGFIAIFEMDFLDINYTNEQLFSILCGWAGVSIEKAKVFEAKQKESRLFENTGFFNFKYFLESLNREILLARRYKTYFAVLTVAVEDTTEMSPDSFNECVTTLGYKIKHVFREVDSFFFNDVKKERFHIILPMTLEDGATIALKKFLADLSVLDLRPYTNPSKSLIVGSSVFGVTPETTNHSTNLFIKENS